MEFGSTDKSSKHLLYVPLSGGKKKALVLKTSKFTGGKGRLKSPKCSRFSSVPFDHPGCGSLADTRSRKMKPGGVVTAFFYTDPLKLRWHNWREVKRSSVRSAPTHRNYKWEVSTHWDLWWLHGNSNWRTPCTVKIHSFLRQITLGLFHSRLFPFPPAGAPQTLGHSKNR